MSDADADECYSKDPYRKLCCADRSFCTDLANAFAAHNWAAKAWSAETFRQGIKSQDANLARVVTRIRQIVREEIASAMEKKNVDE